MIDAYLSVLIDLIVLIFLGATIFYVLHLSKSLNEFKAQRREFDNVITNMISSIDQAERTVHSLKQTGAKEASELEKLVTQSKSLAEELKIINEASENMAKRLENLAETNRKIAQSSYGNRTSEKQPVLKNKISRRINRPAAQSQYEEEAKDNKISSPVRTKNEAPAVEKKRDFQSTLRKLNPKDANDFSREKIPSFMIKDKEYEGESVSNNDGVPDNLQSQAEKELFAALKNSKKNI